MPNHCRALLDQPVAEGPTDEEIYQWWENNPQLGFCTEPVKLIRAVLTRWGNPTPQPPAEGEVGELVEWLREQEAMTYAIEDIAESRRYTRTADILQHQHPQPVAVSELVDLAHELRKTSEYLRGGCGWNKAVEAIERAIELIEGGALQRFAPVPVSERPWERTGWCDEQGRCWAWHPFDPENDETGDYWSRIPWHWIDDIGIWSHCLPHYALPTPGALNV